MYKYLYTVACRDSNPNYELLLLCVVFYPLTDRASTIPSNILVRGCQSGSVRGLLDRKRLEEYLQSFIQQFEYVSRGLAPRAPYT